MEPTVREMLRFQAKIAAPSLGADLLHPSLPHNPSSECPWCGACEEASEMTLDFVEFCVPCSIVPL